MKDHEKSGVEPCRSAETVGKAGGDGQGALVKRLRDGVSRPTTILERERIADCLEALTRENAALRADKERLERERDYARDYAVGKEREVAATIKRVWAALGNPEFETLHGRTISEVVADWKDRAEAAERRLAEQGQVTVDCDRCAGNGEIVTDWDRYRHPHDGDVGDEAVAACPDCFGVGTVTAAPVSQEPVATANCCQCGRIVDTREETEGGDPFGSQIESGKWTCSFECYCKETGQPLTEGEPSEAKRLLDTLREESWDLRCFDVPTGGGDADIGWRIVGHWQAQPCERVIAEVYHDDPQAAIRAALLAAKSKGGQADG